MAIEDLFKPIEVFLNKAQQLERAIISRNSFSKRSLRLILFFISTGTQRAFMFVQL